MFVDGGGGGWLRLKRVCHEMDIIVGLKNYISNFCECAGVFFLFFSFHVGEKVISEVLLASMKLLTNSKSIGACTESTDLTFTTFKKIIHLVTQSL